MKPVLQASSNEWSSGHGLIHAIYIYRIGVESKNCLTALFRISSEEGLVLFVKYMKENRGSAKDVLFDGPGKIVLGFVKKGKAGFVLTTAFE